MKKRILCLLLSCILLLSAAVTLAATPEPAFSLYDIPTEFEDPFAPAYREVQFSELRAARYSGYEEFVEAAARMEAAAGEKNAFEEIKALYEFLYGEMIEILQTAVMVEIEYNTDSRNEDLSLLSAEMNALLEEMFILYQQTVAAVLDSPYGEDFAAFIGEDVAKAFEEDIPDPERLTELSRREQALIMEYYEALQQPLTVEVGGEVWNEARFEENKETMSPEQRSAVENAFYAARNAACAPYYLQLVELRREMAALYGYDSAAEYYYEGTYGRDFSPKEAKKLYANVKRYIVPAYRALTEAGAGKASDAVVKKKEIIPMMEKVMPLISGEMAEILDHMTEHGMIRLVDDLKVSMNAGYTTYLAAVDQPFVYNAVYGDLQGLSDTFHEFGHYCDMYLNTTKGVITPGESYDLAEVCSTGLEMLVYAYYDDMLAGDTADEKLYRLHRSLESIVSGCFYDDVQQQVFDHRGKLTTEAVNDIFRKTAAEYGMDTQYDMGLAWVRVPHTFDRPFYYLSYAASGAAAMEIWLTGQEEGQAAAIDQYLQILSMGSSEYGYAEAMEACGMRGFTSAAFMKELGQEVLEEAEALLAEMEKAA